MYLSKIRIRNFRNFEDFTASFAGGLNVIVGENNIGKSNLLDAIRLSLGNRGGVIETGESCRTASRANMAYYGVVPGRGIEETSMRN